MLTTLVLAAAIVALPDSGGTPADDRAAYEAARDAAAHVQLALWCEARGLAAERVKHMALSVLNDPKQATARGLLGLVEYAGKWQRPEAVADKVAADEALTAHLAEYNRRRAETPNTADAQWKLGIWCESKGLKAEADAHFTAVVRL